MLSRSESEKEEVRTGAGRRLLLRHVAFAFCTSFVTFTYLKCVGWLGGTGTLEMSLNIFFDSFSVKHVSVCKLREMLGE